MNGAWAECPFDECDWTAAEPMHEVEADAVAGGWDRLALHLRVIHGAYPDPDELAWEDGSWQVSLFPTSFVWEGDRLVNDRLNLSGDDQEDA